MIKVKAVKCLHCGDIIFSRSEYDMRFCSCKLSFMYGGPHVEGIEAPGYIRSSLDVLNVTVELEFKTKEECIESLCQDWVNRSNKYGVIKNDRSD